MISVVIPAYNAEKTLAACLDGLRAQTTPHDACEIVVVDDGSTDKTRQVAEANAGRLQAEGRTIRLVTQTNRGAGAARNLGARHARGDILLFLDADSVPDPNWVEAMSRPFADAAVAGVSGEKKTHQQNLWARFVQVEYDYKYERIAAHSTIDFVDSSTAGYRRDVFLANGGFDESLPEAEDVELSFRLAERGDRLVLARDALTYHTHPEALSHYLRRKLDYARWRVVVYARYPRKAASDQRTPPAQKLQPLLAAALIPVIAAALIWPLLWWGAALLGLGFLATTLSFARYCWKASPSVAMVAPVVLLLSAYASGAGAAEGILQRSAGRKLNAKSSP